MIRTLENTLEPFKGNDGTMYRITDISAGRCAYASQKSLELLLCQKAMDFQSYSRELMDLLNASKVADAAVLVSDYSKGVELISSQMDSVMLYCACIFNTEDEDIREVDEAKFEDKVKNWSEINASFFLRIASNTIPGLMQSWQKVADSSEAHKAEMLSLLKSL